MTSLTPAVDTSAADWIVAALRAQREEESAPWFLLPAGFPAYTRIFHPAYRGAWENPEPVRWAEIAAANGTEAHADMQLGEITGDPRLAAYDVAPQPGVFDFRPHEGSLPLGVASTLASALRRHTTAAGSCWFAVWEGFADVRPDIRSAPTFEVEFQRSLYLAGGPLDAAGESLEARSPQSPTLWWPDDHAWCMATEIDFDSTYLGCSEACRAEILALPGVEAWPLTGSTTMAASETPT